MSQHATQGPTGEPTPGGLDPELLARYGHRPNPMGGPGHAPIGIQTAYPPPPRRPMSVKRRTLLGLAIGLGIVLIVGLVSVPIYVSRHEYVEKSHTSKVFATDSRCCRLTATANWSPITGSDVDPDADLQISEGANSVFVSIYSDPADRYADFNEFLQTTEDHWRDDVGAEQFEVNQRQSIDSLPSRRMSFKAEIKNAEYAFWIDLINGKDGHFYTVDGWCLWDDKSDRQDRITRVMDTFETT